MPGMTRVCLSAASVMVLMAMPGAISMNSAACLSSGRKPEATVCRNAGELRLQHVDEGEGAELHVDERTQNNRRQATRQATGDGRRQRRRRFCSLPGARLR